MPTSIGVAVAIATPALSFLAVLLGQWLTRRSAHELDVWRRREDTMRMLRWSAEAAASERPALSRTGVAVLEGLGESELLQDEDRPLVHTVARITARLALAGRRSERYDIGGVVVEDAELRTTEGDAHD